MFHLRATVWSRNRLRITCKINYIRSISICFGGAYGALFDISTTCPSRLSANDVELAIRPALQRLESAFCAHIPVTEQTLAYQMPLKPVLLSLTTSRQSAGASRIHGELLKLGIELSHGRDRRTAAFKLLYALIVLSHHRTRVTQNPTQAWLALQKWSRRCKARRLRAARAWRR
jgi:hypothetical protein